MDNALKIMEEIFRIAQRRDLDDLDTLSLIKAVCDNFCIFIVVKMGTPIIKRLVEVVQVFIQEAARRRLQRKNTHTASLAESSVMGFIVAILARPASYDSMLILEPLKSKAVIGSTCTKWRQHHATIQHYIMEPISRIPDSGERGFCSGATMIYDFWKDYEELLSYEQVSLLDYRLDNIAIKLNTFFQRLIIAPIAKREIRFYLAGSCIKSDTFKDLDMFFPSDEDRKLLNSAMNQDYFEYENNSYTYRYKNDLYQLVYRERFKDATLKELVDGFDFDSTKIAFECTYDTKKRLFSVVRCDMRMEFVNYINTRVNHLSKVSVNPFVSLQRAIYFLKRGDDVPYEVFLQVCSKIADMKVQKSEDESIYFKNLQGNPNKLTNIKEAISHYIEDQKNHHD
jgi:hypothetical protein